jgi:hypothetical protein
MFEGIAKPMPMLPPEGDMICALMPTSSPFTLTSGAARIPAVDRGVSLQEVFITPVAEPGSSAFGAHDAHGNGLADAERIADGQHDVADLNGVGVAERKGLQVGGLHLEQRQIAWLIGADESRVERAAVGQVDVDVVCAFDDVIVGQDISIRTDNDARAEPSLPERSRRAVGERLAKESAQRLSFRHVRGQELGPACHTNGRDGRRDSRDDVRVGAAWRCLANDLARSQV